MTDTGLVRRTKGPIGLRRATKVDSSTTATGKGRAAGSNTTTIGITTAAGEIGIVTTVATMIATTTVTSPIALFTIAVPAGSRCRLALGGSRLASFRWPSFGVHCLRIREHVTVILD